MRNLLLPCSRRFSTRIYALSGILATMLLLTGTVAAQVEPLEKGPVEEEKKEKKRREIEVAFHFYPRSFFFGWGEDLYGGTDALSFPSLDANFRYNAYEGGIAYAYISNDGNGSILRLKSRYNLALAKQLIGKQSNFHIREYLYGGIDLWHFDRKEIQHEHPASKSTILGISMGSGISFYLGGLGLSIEPEYNYIPCREYEEFFCDGWFDIKVGLEILSLLN